MAQAGKQIGRNDPCPCGSGRKFKSCCMGKMAAVKAARSAGAPAAAKKKKPAGVDARQFLQNALAHHRAGRLNDAMRAYRQTLQRDPKETTALLNLGQLLRDAGEPDMGIGLVRRAIAVDSRRSQFHQVLGILLLDAGRPEESLAALQRSIELDAKNPETCCAQARTLEQMNKLEDAEAALHRALAIAPGHAHAELILAGIERRNGNLDSARKRLESLLLHPSLPVPFRQQAFSMLGFVREKRGEFETAFEAFAERGRVAAGGPMGACMDRELLPRRIDAYRRGLTGELMARFADTSFDDPAPMFLVGFLRSGTTMTEQVLAAHPSVVSSGEKPLTAAILDELKRMCPDVDPMDTPAMLEQIDLEQVKTLREAYWRQVEKLCGERPPEGQVFLDKPPLNLIDIGMLNVVFPDSRVIVALRDPRDVCISCFQQEFNLTPVTIHFTTLETTASLYARIMDLYLYLRDMLTLRRVEVRYEDTVADLETQARRMLDALGLAWDPGVLKFNERAREKFIATPSYAAVTEKVHTRAVARWRNYEKHFEPVQATLAPFVEAFGYE